MAYEFLISQISEEFSKLYCNGITPVQGDTICLICSENGTVYKGYNFLAPSGENVHAEVDAVNRMRAEGQSMVRAITVFDSFAMATVIPCNGCLNMLLSIDYRNINTLIATPTGNIPITSFLGNHQGGYQNSQFPGNSAGFMSQGMNSMSMSAYTNPVASAGAPLYMNGGRSIQTVNSINNSQYMNSMHSVNTNIGQKSYAAGGNKKSNVLKNKLNNLLDDED